MQTNKIEGLSISEIFRDIVKVETKPISIENLFVDKKRLSKTNYKPEYQRNYVWDEEKASYFIESILLGTEIPPLIFFDSEDNMEVIDGRQRYETIYRFINDKFTLRKKGLPKLQRLVNKLFSQFDEELKDTFFDTKLRLIIFSLRSASDKNTRKIEEFIKKEVFKRYNSGITPLKNVEIAKAKYVNNDLNNFFKSSLNKDPKILRLVMSVFHFTIKDIQNLYKLIRRLLVLHEIPISYFAIKKEEVSEMFFEELSANLDSEEHMELEYAKFLRKVIFLSEVKLLLEEKNIATNRLIFECLYWAISILDKEGIPLQIIDSKEFKQELVFYISEHINPFLTRKVLFTPEIEERFKTTALFFQDKLNLSYDKYLRNQPAFIDRNKKLLKKTSSKNTLESFDTLRIHRPEPSPNTINDLLRQMSRQRFMLRPSYQRDEVIKINKSSAIIESILLDIKLPPIFIFKRKNGIQEVIDGQQRLLSILGFMEEKYLDETDNLVRSQKNGYKLNLKNGILKELHGKSYKDLPTDLQNKIQEHDLLIVEIKQMDNPGFDPEDLFVRLNNKPYPIKEDTFEMWNSYIDRDIIRRIKSICDVYSDWFYLRKNNLRMDNEELITYLVYLQYCSSGTIINFNNMASFVGIYKTGDKINIRVKAKNDISKVLESVHVKSKFLVACGEFEEIFLKKVQELILDSDSSTDEANKNFDHLLNVKRSSRTLQDFHALWLILSNISLPTIRNRKDEISQEIYKLFEIMGRITSKEEFEIAVVKFWGNNRV